MQKWKTDDIDEMEDATYSEGQAIEIGDRHLVQKQEGNWRTYLSF